MGEEIKVGGFVMLNHIEGFGGKGFIVGEREDAHDCRWLVRLMDGSQPDLWAFTGELKPIAMDRDDVMRATHDHIRRVGMLLADAINRLTVRAVQHDRSKFSEIEWPHFLAATPGLASLTYGSDEYKAALQAIKPALVAHNRSNSHHPEHYSDGIDGMDLLDLLEMMCDWKAATERRANGDISKSLEHNRERFKIGPQLESILRNTVERMGWMPLPAPPDAGGR